MQAIFGIVNEDRRTAKKNPQNITAVEIVLKSKSTVEEPVLNVSYNEALLQCNYVYLTTFSRYYYCRVEVGEDQTMTVYCEVDTLMSFLPYILNLYCLIDRQENVYSPYYVDNELLTRCDKVQSVINVGTVGIDNNLRYYLVTTGG